MEALVTVKDVMRRYKCSLPTARKYIRECNPHMEKPLAAPEKAFAEWERKRTVYKRPVNYQEAIRRFGHGEQVIVPRKR